MRHLLDRLDDAKFQRRLHAGLTIFWLAAAVPTLLWWRESVFWVALMSLWANVAAHWAAYQGARADRSDKD